MKITLNKDQTKITVDCTGIDNINQFDVTCEFYLITNIYIDFIKIDNTDHFIGALNYSNNNKITFDKNKNSNYFYKKNTLINLITDAIKVKNIHKININIEKLYKLDKNIVHIYYFIGLINFYKNNFDESESSLLKCLQINSNYYHAVELLIKIYTKLKKYQSIEKISNLHIINNLWNINYELLLIEINLYRGNIIVAERKLEKVINISIEDKDINVKILILKALLINSKSKNKTEVIDLFKEVIKIDKSNEIALLNIKKLEGLENNFNEEEEVKKHVDHFEFDKAELKLLKLIKRKNNIDAIKQLINLYLLIGENSKALEIVKSFGNDEFIDNLIFREKILTLEACSHYSEVIEQLSKKLIDYSDSDEIFNVWINFIPKYNNENFIRKNIRDIYNLRDKNNNISTKFLDLINIYFKSINDYHAAFKISEYCYLKDKNYKYNFIDNLILLNKYQDAFDLIENDTVGEPCDKYESLAQIKLLLKQPNYIRCREDIIKYKAKYGIDYDLILAEIALFQKKDDKEEAIEVAVNYYTNANSTESKELLISTLEYFGEYFLSDKYILKFYKEDQKYFDTMYLNMIIRNTDKNLIDDYINKLIKNEYSLQNLLKIIKIKFKIKDYNKVEEFVQNLQNDFGQFQGSKIPLVQILLELNKIEEASIIYFELLEKFEFKSDLLNLGLDIISQSNVEKKTKFINIVKQKITNGDYYAIESKYFKTIGDIQNAILSANKYVKLSNSKNSLILLLNLYQETENYFEILNLVEYCLKQWPYDFTFKIIKAYSLNKSKNFYDSLKIYEQLIVDYPYNIDIVEGLLSLYCDMGDWVKWDKLYKDSIENLGLINSINIEKLLFQINYHPGVIGDNPILIYNKLKFNKLIHSNYKKLSIKKYKHRIGYVTGDLRRHAMFPIINELIRKHDYKNFEIILYSTLPLSLHDDKTFSLLDCGIKFKDVSFLSIEQLTRVISIDDIDILVDLSQNTSFNRLPVFLNRVAPVQLTTEWSHVQSSGYNCFDGILIDPLHLNSNFPNVLMEKPILIKGMGSLNILNNNSYNVNFKAKLNKKFTFVFPSRPQRLNDFLIKTWALIFNDINFNSECVLRLDHPSYVDSKFREVLFQRFSLLGFPCSKLEICFTKNYSEIFNNAHIMLDSFPANGATVVRDSLNYGVPVLSLSLRSMMGSTGTCYLSFIEFDNLIASNIEEYISTAVTLSNDIIKTVDYGSQIFNKMNNNTEIVNLDVITNIMDAYKSLIKEHSL
jgi:predicted O-linked N-acetylglucosamine transferase (SPINDLY family)